jgi:dsDNA-specific endonuclease/ATPase MutS2
MQLSCHSTAKLREETEEAEKNNEKDWTKMEEDMREEFEESQRKSDKALEKAKRELEDVREGLEVRSSFTSICQDELDENSNFGFDKIKMTDSVIEP